MNSGCTRKEGLMTTFDSREQAFERMFVRDQEVRFRALARRNKRLGNWAAEKLGLSGEAAVAFVHSIRDKVASSDADPDEEIVGQLLARFKDAGVGISEHQIRRT